MTERLEKIYSELLEKCKNIGNYEFDYFWEIWGVMWYPWFIEIEGVNQVFSLNDISENDINQLLELGFIELVKVYSKDEMKDEFDRKRYRLIDNSR